MSANFDLIAGDTKTLEVDVKANGVVVNIGAASAIIWQMSTSPFADNSVVSKGLGTGVTITSGPQGLFTVRLDSADTILLGGVYYHFARVTLGSEIATIFLGLLAISPGGGLVNAEMIKARFPEFAAVGNATIQMIIDECAPSVGTSWETDDRVPALMYLVAHTLAIEGEPNRSLGKIVGDVRIGVMKRRRVGDTEVEYAGSSGSGAAGSGSTSRYETTPYGQRFRQYLRQNFASMVVV